MPSEIIKTRCHVPSAGEEQPSGVVERSDRGWESETFKGIPVCVGVYSQRFYKDVCHEAATVPP